MGRCSTGQLMQAGVHGARAWASTAGVCTWAWPASLKIRAGKERGHGRGHQIERK
jgi:hypothetical protein